MRAGPLRAASLLLAMTAVASPHARADERDRAEPPRAEPEAEHENEDEAGEPGAASAIAPVIVEATRADAELLDVPAAVSVIDKGAISEGRAGLALDEALARAPGVFTQNRYNFAQGLRLSIRGFGARAPFGVRGLAVVVDGIPATTIDGQSQLDGYDPAFIERVEVIRGPASALYGNAAGGVVRITTLRPPEEPYGEAEILAGSDGRFTQRVHAGGRRGDTGAAAYGSSVELLGHRDHASAVLRRAGLAVSHTLGGRHELEVQARVLDAPRSLDPGGLTAEQLRDDPSQANAFNARMRAGDEVAQQQAALRWRSAPAPGELWEAQAFVQHRDFAQRIPVPPPGPGWIEFDRIFGGGGLRHARPFSLAGLRGRLTAGLDAGYQRDDRQRYENQQGQRGALRQDQLERARSAGLYGQAEITLAEAWWITAGARVDHLRLALDDRFDEGDDDRSGSRSFLEPSVLGGITWRYHAKHAAYGNLATAFESPTFVELRSPEPAGRGFNPELGAQDAVSGELGAKGFLGRAGGRYDLAVFVADVRGELISYEQDGIDFFRNAGRTRRMGVEAAALATMARGFEAAAAASVGDFRFRDYLDTGGAQHRGRAIPGLPRAHGYLELAWRGPGVRLAGDLRAATGVYVDDANTLASPAFADLGLRASRAVRHGEFRGRAFLGFENLLGRAYAANVRINPAGNNPFEPAPGRGVYLGVALTWGPDHPTE
jgi:iron complex outermembrane recepter protein